MNLLPLLMGLNQNKGGSSPDIGEMIKAFSGGGFQQPFQNGFNANSANPFQNAFNQNGGGGSNSQNPFNPNSGEAGNMLNMFNMLNQMGGLNKNRQTPKPKHPPKGGNKNNAGFSAINGIAPEQILNFLRQKF